MSDIEIFISTSPGETRLALTRNGILHELVIGRDIDQHQTGNIYLGRVEKVMTGLNAAFVQIGERNSGFLAAPDGQIFDRDREKPKPINALFKEGDKVLLQATRDEEGDKGAKLTTRLSLVGRNLVLTPDRSGISVSKSVSDDVEKERLKTAVIDAVSGDAGLIVRTRAQNVDAKILIAEGQILNDAWIDMQASLKTMNAPALLHEAPGPILGFINAKIGKENWRRILVNDRSMIDQIRELGGGKTSDSEDLLVLHAGQEDIFDSYDLNQQIDNALSNVVPLKSGGEIIIEETAALTAIDVNSGGGNRRGDAEGWALSVNREAAQEAGRQILLRNLSGQIVIDFLPMDKRESKDEVAGVLQQALASDRSASNVFGFTRLGLLEMTRRRQGKSLTQRLLAQNEHGKSAETVALEAIRSALQQLENDPGRRIKISAGASVYEAYQRIVAQAWAIAEKQSGGMIALEQGTSTAPMDCLVTAMEN